jgi:hypothetical protein
MNFNKYFILIIIAIIFHSCYKDEGNYDYKNLNRINDIKIKEGQKKYNINKGEDILKITPEFSYRMDENKDTYEYKWILHLPDKTEMEISTERNLIFDSKGKKFPSAEMNLIFIAKNLTTGVSISESFWVNFMNEYTHGTFILHENGENSELTLIKTNGTVAKNIYQEITGRNLKGTPMKLVKNTPGRPIEYGGDGKDFRFFIFTNGHDYGTVLNYLTLEYFYSISDCFRGKNPPEGLNFKFLNSDGNPYYYLVNGELYKTNTAAGAETNPYITLNFPEIENDNTLDFINSGGFVHSASGKLYSSHTKPIKVDDQEVSMPGKCFDIFKELTPYNPSPIEVSKYHILVGGNNNTVKDYLLTIESEFNWDTWEEKVTYQVTSDPFIAPDLLTEKSFFANSSLERYFYIAQGNKIYRYNYDAPNERPTVFYEFDAGLEITYFEITSSYNDQWMLEEEILVCTYDPNKTGDNASLYNMDFQGGIIKEFKNICGKINSVVVKE